MKFLDTYFDEYIQSVNKISLHPKLTKQLESFPDDINNLKNTIFYGPSGTGKYSQLLNSIKKYSNSKLKYEKKLTVVSNKNNYFFKISDIHFEIDMELLGCNSKLLWNDIYINIIDILSSRNNKNGIIVCKNFHKINDELLECFYSYIQICNKNINIIYFFTTEHISFIPCNIINICYIVSIPRPSKSNYNKIINNTDNNNDKLLKVNKISKVNEISNIKYLFTNNIHIIDNITNYVDKLYWYIYNPNTINFTDFRNVLYDVFIYDMEIGNVIWLLIKKISKTNNISIEKMSYIYVKTFLFLQLYNNNYRSIYHLENYLYSLITNIHEFK